MDRTHVHPFLSLPKFGTGTGLYRVSYLLDYLRVRIEDISGKSLVVTGSNGKGSTSKISSELLQALGFKVGLFTSPHLYRYNERFQINGLPIGDDALQLCMSQVMNAVQEYEKNRPDKVGAFEAQMALALKWFTESNVDCMVLEAGIGGRFDPVRAAKSKAVALVSLDLEHTELLGNTLQEIALDKLDACDTEGSVVCGISCQKVRPDIEAAAERNKLQLQFLSEENWNYKGVAGGLSKFNITTKAISLNDVNSSLVGEHQLNNHAVAVELCHAFLKRAGKWDKEAAQRAWPGAIANVRWPGRLERISDTPPVYIDVGHTPDGIFSALEGFKSLNQGRDAVLVIGGSYNKKVSEMVGLLSPSFNVILCSSAYHKGANATDVADEARRHNPNATIFVEPAIEAAVERSLELAKQQGRSVYVAGGLFLAIEFAYTLRGGDPKALQFF